MDELIENALENTYGTTDADDFVEMADEGVMDEVALAHMLAAELEDEEMLAQMEEEEIASAIAQAMDEEAFVQAMDEEAFAEALAHELAAEQAGIDEELLANALVGEFEE